jgi:solute:Na+ symporter, SSS family
MQSGLTTLDYLVVAIYLIGTVGLGLAIGWKFQTGRDFFLAGRTLPWWAIGMSLVASDIGGTDIIGVGGAAYAHGLAVANFEWIGCVPAMIVAAFLFVPIFWRMGIYTIPEFMERRFNVGVRSALGLCWLVFMACNVGIMLYASARMLHSLTGFSEAACIWVTAGMVGIYTIGGGLKAVVYTDVIQCAVMIGGCLLVLGIGLYDLGGIDGLREQLAALGERTQNHTTLIVPADAQSPFPWPAILFGLAFILSPAYWIGNQAIMQRSLGAKSQFHAQAAYVWGALLKILIPVIIAVPGLIAIAKFPDLATPDAAFPTLAAQLLPTGIRGLFLAAFIAALMSSVDSYLNASATVATKDFYLRFVNREADDHSILKIGRIVTVVLMAWGIGFAFFIRQAGENTGIYTIFQTLMSFFQGPALAMILTGFFWKRANGFGALSGFLCGIICAVGLFVLHNWHEAFGLEPLFRIEEPFLYFSIWSFVVALIVIVLVSLMTKPEPPEKTAFLTLNDETVPINP